jgi:hypothetical protein
MKNYIKGGISILGVLFLCFIIILVLSYFRINIRSVVESPTGQENLNYVKGEGTGLWNNYLKKPATYFWQDIFVEIFWKSFINNMERIRDGQPTDYEKAAPVVPLTSLRLFLG